MAVRLCSVAAWISQSACCHQIEYLSPSCCWQGKIISGVQPLVFMSNGYAALPSLVALSMAHILGVDFKEKLLTLVGISILSFLRLETVCLCDPYCLDCHWNSGSNYNGSICFLTFTQQWLVKPFTVQGPVLSGEQTRKALPSRRAEGCVSRTQEEL